MGNKKKYRYPGINFFTKEDQDIFCGRADDSQRLFNRIMLNNTLVLHGESGSGKSSLVQAGLLPLIEKQNEHLLSLNKPQYLPITVRLDTISKKSNEDNVKPTVEGNLLVRQIMNGINEWGDYKAKQIPFISKKENNFWYTAKLFERNNYTLLLILDQFEELQGYSNRETEDFAKNLSELFATPMPEDTYDEYDIITAELFNAKGMTDEERKVYNENIKFIEQPLNVRILYVVREDKLGTMSLLTDYFPDILKNDFFLLPLNEKSARSAIVEPAQIDGNFHYERFSFDDKAINNLLQNLVDSNGLYDPIQLQIVCCNIERKISVNKKVIKKEHIPPVNNIIRDFYRETWNGIQKEIKLTNDDFERKRRLIIEDLVIKDSRNLVLQELLIVDGDKLDETIIKSLVRDGLLRKIPAGKETYYQLSHDRLISPLKDDRKELELKEKEKAANQQRELELNQRILELAKTRNRLRIVIVFLGVALLALVTAVYFGVTAHNAKIAADIARVAADNATIAANNAIKEKEELSKTLIGAKYEGGIVFYWNDSTGQHGLIATEKDFEVKYNWEQAKEKCDNLIAGGKTDWRLPTRDELMLLFANRNLVGGFNKGTYWSSTEGTTGAWGLGFNFGYQYDGKKSYISSVRAIRDF